MAWLSVPSTRLRNRAKNDGPMFANGSTGVLGDWGIKRGGTLTIPVTNMNFKKFPESTDHVRLNTWPILKFPCVKRPAGSAASVMGHPRLQWHRMSVATARVAVHRLFDSSRPPTIG